MKLVVARERSSVEAFIRSSKEVRILVVRVRDGWSLCYAQLDPRSAVLSTCTPPRDAERTWNARKKSNSIRRATEKNDPRGSTNGHPSARKSLDRSPKRPMLAVLTVNRHATSKATVPRLALACQLEIACLRFSKACVSHKRERKKTRYLVLATRDGINAGASSPPSR